MLCKAPMMYGYREASSIRNSTQFQAELKSEHQQIFRLAIRKDGTRHISPYNGGAKVFEVSSFLKIIPTASLHFTHIANTATKTFKVNFLLQQIYCIGNIKKDITFAKVYFVRMHSVITMFCSHVPLYSLLPPIMAQLSNHLSL